MNHYYLFIQRQLMNKFPRNFYINYKEALSFIPTQKPNKIFSKIILQDMEKHGLIKFDMKKNRTDQSKIIITKAYKSRVLDRYI